MKGDRIGPVTEAIFRRKEGEPPAVIREWASHLKHAGEFIFFWAGAFHGDRGAGWACLATHFGEKRSARAAVQNMSAAAVERLLGPLAHEGRVRIMQALFQRTLTASALAKATGFAGGGLYHHLRELQLADYVVSEGGKYRLTRLGCELLITVLSMANEVIEDRGQRGLGVGTHWQERKR